MDNKWFIINADPNALTWVEKTALDKLLEQGYVSVKLSDMATATYCSCPDSKEV